MSADQQALIRRAIADPGSVVAARLPEETGPAWSARAVEQALLAAGWTPPPRVFLEGDDIPCHMPVIDNHGEVRDEYQDYDEGDGEVYTANFDVVEMNIDYDAAVARERARREQQS